jgi:P27 family predicted phage terminase small subunit
MGRRGPPRLPTNLHILRGNPSKLTLRPENEPQPIKPPEPPEPPPGLKGYAVEEWRLVAGELWRLGLYTICDKGALSAYCDAYGTWMDAAITLQECADRDPIMRGLLVKRDNFVNQNPLVQIKRKAAGDMVRYAAEFGFTPAARSRIAVGPDRQEERKFAGLLAG